jgi:hypothetical protein
LETNSPADHSKNVFVVNNLYDYENSLFGAGSAVCLQNPYPGPNHGLVVAQGNMAIGGREDVTYRYMSNGFLLNGLIGCQIRNNYVFRTGQDAIQAHGIKGCVIENNDFECTGGGGNPTLFLINTENNIFRRNSYRERPGLAVSVIPRGSINAARTMCIRTTSRAVDPPMSLGSAPRGQTLRIQTLVLIFAASAESREPSSQVPSQALQYCGQNEGRTHRQSI